MNVVHLKYAVEVEKTGSISQAAENLFMAQPNLSKAIKELENNLGITIFKRTSKAVSYTHLFDPGATKSICYVDGDLSEWKGVTPITKTKDISLSMMYDERNLYLRIHKENLNLEKDTIYVPLNITPKSGAFTDETNHLTYTRPVDFVAVIQGKGNSRVLVQDYYHTAKALYLSLIHISRDL